MQRNSQSAVSHGTEYQFYTVSTLTRKRRMNPETNTGMGTELVRRLSVNHNMGEVQLVFVCEEQHG